jgi:hypothetical protein
VVVKHPYRVLALLEYAHVQNVDLRNPIEEEFLAWRRDVQIAALSFSKNELHYMRATKNQE